jgi:hypothetical protein
MPSAFERYAKYYDLLYGDKDYEAECDLVEDLLRKNSRGKVEDTQYHWREEDTRSPHLTFPQ